MTAADRHSQMIQRDDRIEDAASLLRFYFKNLYKAVGLKWDGDNDAEIGDIVSRIVDAART